MQQNTETYSFISLFPWESGGVKPLVYAVLGLPVYLNLS